MRSYTYRHYPPGSERYERCIGLVWCPACRQWSSAMLYVPRNKVLDDPLGDLDAEKRARLLGNERVLVQYLDRLPRTD